LTYRQGTDRIIKGSIDEFRSKTMPALWEITDRTDVKTPMRKWCRERVQYGHVNATTGYLRIFSFSHYSDSPGFVAGLTALESALDEIFSDPNLKALVIDVRINFGGEDPYGLAIASRLATRSYVAYMKMTRADPVDRNKWSTGDLSVVRPSSRPSCHGPVVELTGPLTISAGETFTQALMGRRPRVLRIGENTQGVFSDVLGRNCPTDGTSACPTKSFGRRKEQPSMALGFRPTSLCPCSPTMTPRRGGIRPWQKRSRRSDINNSLLPSGGSHVCLYWS
jgi:C-terminal processing protease CtpA/Prc